MSIPVSVSTAPEADKAPHNGPRRTETGQDGERVHNADFKPNHSGDDARSESTLIEKDAVFPDHQDKFNSSCFPESRTPQEKKQEQQHDDDDDDDNVGDCTVVYPKGTRRVLILASLCMSVFLVALDQTIIAPALGAITAQSESVTDIGWYGSAYLLTTTALQPLYGELYGGFPVKAVYLVAVSVFEVGSLVCAAAPSSTAFIVGRALAGMGTAGLFSGAIVVLSYTLPLRRRPMDFGLIGDLPIGGATLVAIIFLLHVKGQKIQGNVSFLDKVRKLDVLGTGVLIPAVICLLLALQWGGTEYPWGNSRIIGLFVASAALTAIFIGIQIWKGDDGTLPPRLFRNRNILCAMLYTFLFGSAFYPIIYYLSVYFQAVRGDSAVGARVKLLPLLISCVLTSILSGALVGTVIGHYNPTGLRRAYYITVACAAGAFCAAAGLSWVNIKKLGPRGVVKGVEQNYCNSEMSGDVEKDVKSQEPRGKK